MFHRDHNYRTQAVRDLAWALTSPPLMAHPRVVGQRWGELELARNQNVAARLDGDDDTLRRAIRHRETDWLGEYFEILLATWLREITPAEFLGANIQVHGGEGTIGEFDLVFRRDGMCHHWELAAKFYLGHPGPRGEQSWYGPNPRDRLDKKWTRLCNHQLRLAEQPAARDVLHTLGVDGDVDSRAFLKGYFYVPLDASYEVELHPDANEDAVRGWWVHRSSFEEHRDRLEPEEPLRWMRLPRLRWLSPARLTDRDREHHFDDLLDALHPGRPAHVAGLAETDEGPREVTRGFIVPDSWLER